MDRTERKKVADLQPTIKLDNANHAVEEEYPPPPSKTMAEVDVAAVWEEPPTNISKYGLLSIEQCAIIARHWPKKVVN